MDTLLQKIVLSAGALVLVMVAGQILKFYAKKTQQRLNLHKSRYFAIKRAIWFVTAFIFMLSLIIIWGINLKNLWASLTAVLAMIAVAFFAVWSLVGNILAGIILFFTVPFKINNSIELLPDGIKGKVMSINTFYTLLVDEEDNYINIPNSLFFQKCIKNYRGKQK